MKKQTLRQSLNTGVVFGIVHIFLVLVSFNTLMASLLGKLVGGSGGTGALVAYAALLGLWAGASSAKKQDSAKGRLQVSLVTGAAFGLMGALLAVVFVIFLQNKVNPRDYVTVLSFPFMRSCLFGLEGAAGVAANFAVFFLSTVTGGMLSLVWNLPGVTATRQRCGRTCRDGFTRLKGGSPKAKKTKTYILYGLLFLLVAILPLQWGSYWNYVMGTVGLYVILGLGLNIIVGLSGQLVLGYIAFFAIGAYSMALLNAPEPHHLMWGFWPALVIGILLAALAGLLVGLPIMRLRGDYLAIVTLGFGEIIRILLKSDVLTSFTGGPRGIQDIKGPTLFGQPFNEVGYVYLIFAAVGLAIFVYARLQHSRTGRAWTAIREDETVARATGVDTGRYKLMALMIGAAFAGLAGGIYAARNQFTGPDEHALMASVNVLCLIIVGGLGNIPGTLLGAFALKGLPEILREVENYRMLAFGALLVAMMIVRPEGLIPSRRATLHLPDEPDEPAPPGVTSSKKPVEEPND
jgi:ABC-type branched-subunit amino acid transport system permease subunit